LSIIKCYAQEVVGDMVFLNAEVPAVRSKLGPSSTATLYINLEAFAAYEIKPPIANWHALCMVEELG